MNYWLHRISHHAEVSYPLLEQGYLSIGWIFLSKPAFIDEICGENGRQKFEAYLLPEGSPPNRYNLWRFIVDMKKGDWVVVPSCGAFSVFEIEDDKALSITEITSLVKIQDSSGNSIEMGKDGYLYNTGRKDEKGANSLVDLGFFKKVKPVKTDISRYEYADAALTSRMKLRRGNAYITDLKESIEAALTAFNEEKPLNIYLQIVEKAGQQILDTIQSKLNPGKFERLVKWYFERIGATKVDSPTRNESGKEGDADVVAIFEAIKTIIYTQVKFHSGETSSWAIEQINDYKTPKNGIDDGYSKIAWVISSGDSFSNEAKNMAQEANVQLFDGITFAKMLLEAGIANLSEANM